ncbi:ABC transporter permease [Ilumatobacter sp.]|uniref:ABC transporter permease n=1 Tax=Ilumatobacter sp. TaxID=1967498 RepID=UPI0037524C2C
MIRYTLRSLFSLWFAAFVGSIAVFALVNVLGGDIVTVLLGREAAPVDVEFMREELGLDRPLVMQYLDWLRGALTGDLGTSYGMGYDIFDEIVRRIEPTLMITVGALLISVPLSLALGTYSAINAKKVRGGFVDVVTQVGIAIPTFWAGLLFVLLFAVRLGWLPTGGYVPLAEDPVGSLRTITLPVLALSLGVTAVFTRYVRTAMIDVMNEDFIRSAMARGRSRRGAALVHGVRNASIPLVTVAALQFGQLLAGAVVVENVFVLPGIGRLIVTATLGREVVVVQSLALVIMLFILILNFLVDIAYGFLDPRIRDKADANA